MMTGFSLPELRRAIGLILSLVLVWGAILGCNFSGISNRQVLTETPGARTGTAQAVRGIQETLSSLATQTASAVQVEATQAPPSPTPTSTPPTPTITPLTPTATNTSLPPTSAPATRAPQVLTDVIHFRKGGTSAYLEKPIRPGAPHLYSIRALADQTLILTATSPGSDVFLGLKGLQDGVKLLRSNAGVSYWTGVLPKTQDYQITVTTSNPDTYYFLSVEIPANIRFATGAYSATIDGYLDVDQDYHPAVMTRVRYLAYAFAGQTMTVELTSPNLEALSLGIVGQGDGQAYIRYEVKNSAAELFLPATQGYYLDVYGVNGVSTAFALKVTIR